MMKRIIVAISGASGAIYGVRLLQILSAVPDVETHLVISQAGAMTIKEECGSDPDEVRSLANVSHSIGNIGASIASGSFRAYGMIVAPCSIKTMSNIANGNAGDLITRSADVMMKERRRLVLMVRETPLHAGHLENMAALSRMGVTIFPPVPAFYHRPQSLQDIVDQTCMRTLDQLDIVGDQAPRWGEKDGVAAFGQKSLKQNDGNTESASPNPSKSKEYMHD